MNERNDFDNDDHFADFIKSLTESDKNDNAVCGLDGSDCDSCGS